MVNLRTDYLTAQPASLELGVTDAAIRGLWRTGSIPLILMHGRKLIARRDLNIYHEAKEGQKNGRGRPKGSTQRAVAERFSMSDDPRNIAAISDIERF